MRPTWPEITGVALVHAGPVLSQRERSLVESNHKYMILQCLWIIACMYPVCWMIHVGSESVLISKCDVIQENSKVANITSGP